MGPSGRVHGGIAVGLLTCPALQLAESVGMLNPVVNYLSGRLHAPVPLNTLLEAQTAPSNDGFTVELYNGDSLVVSGTVNISDVETSPGSIIKQVPSVLTAELETMSELANAELDGPTILTQYYQHCANAGVDDDIVCYGCSEKSHALKLYNRVTKDGDLWTHWTLEPEQIDSPGRLATAVVTAALDCSNLWVLQAREPELSLRMRMHDKKAWITGTHSVHFLRTPSMHIDYRVVTRFIRQEGRKGFTMAVLLDQDGSVYAVAEAISILIELPPELDVC